MKVREWLDNLMQKWTAIQVAPIAKIAEWLDFGFQAKIKGALIDTIEDIESEAIDMARPHIDDMLKCEVLPENIQKYLQSLKVQKAPIQLVALLPIIVGALFFALAGILTGWFEQVKQWSMSKFTPTLYDPDRAIMALWSGKISHEEYVENMKQQGFSAEKIEVIEKISRFVPGVQDLIRFTVRDVFREDIVKQYRYDEGFDEIKKQLQPWLDKNGLDSDIMRAYWRAHWELPGLTQAFEMLHRGYIDKDDLRQLLKIADVAPAYIEPILRISYAPYTRVDIRRMYGLGVVDEKQVFKTYQDLGYDEEHAENLTRYTVLDAVAAEKDLSKSEVITGYTEGIISEREARTAFTDMGYSDDEADIIISLQDYKKEKSIRDREKAVIANLYYYGKITRPEAVKGLNALNVTEREKELTLAETEARIREKHANPTKADLTAWLKGEIITKAEYQNEMRNLGYSEINIERYLKSL